MFSTTKKSLSQMSHSITGDSTADAVRPDLLKEVPKLYRDMELSFIPRQKGNNNNNNSNNNIDDHDHDQISIPIHNLSLKDPVGTTDKPSHKTDTDSDNKYGYGFLGWKKIIPTNNNNNNNNRRPDQNRDNPRFTELPETKLGNFENPVLEKLVKRSINKEQEFRKLIINIVFLSLWNLAVKFTKFIVTYTSIGQELLLQQRVYWALLLQKLQRQNGITTLAYQNWGVHLGVTITTYQFERTVNLVVHLVVLYNLLVAIWKLFSSVKTSDLNLNTRQRRLLGLDPTDDNDTNNHNQQELGSISRGRVNRVVTELPRTPFLFKQTKPQDNNNINTGVAWNDKLDDSDMESSSQVRLRKDTFGTGQYTVNSSSTEGAPRYLDNKTQTSYNVGYIPSEKYTYMMSSPRVPY